MQLRDLFEGMDVAQSVALQDEFGNMAPATDTTIAVLDEVDEIIADKLLGELAL